MLRNHVLGDAESPVKGGSKYQQGGDEWYSASSNNNNNDFNTNQSSGQSQYNQQQQYHQSQYQQQPQYNQQQQPSSFSYSNPNTNNAYGGSNSGYSNNMGSMHNMGSIGGMNMNMGGMGSSSSSSYSIDPDEPPLLEELGIRFDHIWYKTQAVMYPLRRINGNILDDADLAGPFIYALVLGALLLFAGKVHFGYIYGFSTFGCLSMYAVINLIHPREGCLDFWRTCSVLGYCLLPVLFLATISIIFDLRGYIGMLLAFCSVAWCTWSSTRLLDATIELTDQYWLVAYPISLLYCCFVLITIF